MRKLGKKLIDSALIARFTRRWSAKADRAPQTELSVLRKQAGQARALRRHLDKLIYTAEDRLALRGRENHGLARLDRYTVHQHARFPELVDNLRCDVSYTYGASGRDYGYVTFR